MSRKSSDLDNMDLNVSVTERTLPFYPSTPTAAAQGASENTHVSAVTGVTPRVSDYGREVRQRAQGDETLLPGPSNNILAGLEGTGSTESIARPQSIDDEDLKDSPIHGSKGPIKDLLNAALQPDKCNQERRFLPRKDMENICSYQAVLSELRQQFDESPSRECAEYVCQAKEPAREIFAILVLINCVDFIPKFKKAGIVDSDLPFGGSEGQRHLWSRRSKSKSPIDFLIYPTHAEMMREFYNKQWWVHVPFLGRGKDGAVDYRFELGTVMPWTFVGEKIENGGYGKVQEVKIHKDHHSFTEDGTNMQSRSFALKTLHPDQEDNLRAFRQEISAFRKMSPGPHLVGLCATFEIGTGNSFMLLFPWAKGGSLEHLFQKTNIYVHTNLSEKEFVQWIAYQCRGLVEALGAIHDTRVAPKASGGEGQDAADEEKYYGIHGDIKPANILHFSQDKQHPLGTLKVADFGLMKFHCRGSRTKKSPGTAGAASQAYRSPEHDLDQTMSRKVDSWALGCVLSELITWVLRGPEALDEYQETRSQESTFSGDTRDKGDWFEDNFFVKHKPRGRKVADESESEPESAITQDAEPRKRARPLVKGLMRRIYRGKDPSRSDTKTTPRLKASVKKWIKGLILEAGEATFLAEFLAFIRDEMLHPERDRRADCKRILGFFEKCYAKGTTNGEYWSLMRTSFTARTHRQRKVGRATSELGCKLL